MERDHDEMTEFDLISGELAQMGVDEEDIVDLKLLGSMMNDFVSVPVILPKNSSGRRSDNVDASGLPNTSFERLPLRLRINIQSNGSQLFNNIAQNLPAGRIFVTLWDTSITLAHSDIDFASPARSSG